jgi:Glycosyltransferase family 87
LPSVCATAIFGHDRPKGLEKIWAAISALAVLGLFLAMLRETLVLHRGDVQVFFRAGWAVWSGYPLYQVTDDHGWSYHYPPTFALLMGPFADPLPGFATPCCALPYPVSLVVWFTLGVCALVGTSHILADAIARFSGERSHSRADNPYWALRLLPPLALVAFVGVGWIRGQPTTIILFLVTLFLVWLCDRRPLAASLALSVAISIKMFPAALLLIPLLRRDVRTLAYTLVLTALLLFAFPALCLGWHATAELYRALWIERLQGLLSGEVNPRIASELSPWSVKMVSVGAMLARLVSEPALDAPFRLPAWATYVQYGFDLVVVFAISIAGYGRFWRLTAPQDAARYPILLAGALLMAVLPAMMPVATPHYWTFQIPLVAMLLAERWRRTGRPSPGHIAWAALALVAFAATGPDAPGILSRLGPTTIIMLVPVVVGLVALRRTSTDDARPKQDPTHNPQIDEPRATSLPAAVGGGRRFLESCESRAKPKILRMLLLPNAPDLPIPPARAPKTEAGA